MPGESSCEEGEGEGQKGAAADLEQGHVVVAAQLAHSSHALAMPDVSPVAGQFKESCRTLQEDGCSYVGLSNYPFTMCSSFPRLQHDI